MSTKLPRVYVTFPDDIWDMVAEFRQTFGFKSLSSAVVALVARGLSDYIGLMRLRDE